jgi:anti-sigma regulatory factor (Ser/Thr protein kinase)
MEWQPLAEAPEFVSLGGCPTAVKDAFLMTTAPVSENRLAIFSEHDLRPARRAVREIAETLPFDPRQVADITLAVAEACCNGVRYGHPAGDAPMVTVITREADGYLAIEVADRGEGFSPAPPRMPEARADSGRGIALMHALMDTVAIESTSLGTRVRMIKYFSRGT